MFLIVKLAGTSEVAPLIIVFAGVVCKDKLIAPYTIEIYAGIA